MLCCISLSRTYLYLRFILLPETSRTSYSTISIIKLYVVHIHHIIGDESCLNLSTAIIFYINISMAGLVGSIEAYNPKSDDWSTYKGQLEFYLQINKITDAAMKRAALLTLIGNAGFRMLADLHVPNKLIDVTYDALIEDLDKAYGRNFQNGVSGTLWNYFSTRRTEYRRVHRRASPYVYGLRLRQPARQPP